MSAGDVRAIRELRNDRVQAEVCIGFSPSKGNVWLKLETGAGPVTAALAALRAALVDAADATLREAQQDSERRGRPVIGRAS
jgi:hypothetical protein